MSVRDRFVAFAFVAADLLVEASPEGIIGFAAGAFMPRLGSPASHFHGRHVRELIAPIDQTSFGVALATTAAYGRSPPVIVRLADARQTSVSVASLLVPGPHPRLCLTFGAAPAAAWGEAEGKPPSITEGTVSIVHEASRRLRADSEDAGQIGLLELKGWNKAREAMGAAEHERLRHDIGAALAACGGNVLTSEVADGRFSLLGSGMIDIEDIVAEVERVIANSPARDAASVRGTGLALGGGRLGPAEAAKALRFALACFAGHGVEGAVEAGGAEGLGGIVAKAARRVDATRRAIADERFDMRFQPVTEIADRRLHHYEALLRPVATPEIPLTSPQEFVTFTEMVGLAEELDTAVMQHVIGVLLATPAVSIAVNVSGVSIQNPSFCDQAIAAADAANLGGRMMIELTETAEIEDMAAAASHMARLRAAGIPLCLDDFGAGAASFRYLRQFPIDIVKIDGLYVRGATRSPRDRAFVSSIVDLASSAGATTVAEMIETEEQARLMQDLGVRFGQGWLFGRPGKLPE